MRASIIQFPMCAMAIFRLLGSASLAIFIHSFTGHRLDLLCESLRRIVSYYCAGSKEKGKKEEEEKENPLDLPILSAVGGVHRSTCSFKKKKRVSTLLRLAVDSSPLHSPSFVRPTLFIMDH